MRIHFAMATILFLGGCVVQTVKLDAPSIGLALTDVMPTERELEGTRNLVVILPTNQSLSALAREAEIGSTLETVIEQYIQPTAANIMVASQGAAQQNEHFLASRLEQDIQQFETTGINTQNDLIKADFAISSMLTDAKVTASFYPVQNWTDKKGQVYKVPAKCTYTASISGNIRIYSIQPRLTVLDTLVLNHTLTSTVETRTTECQMSDQHKNELLTKAARLAVKNIRVQLQNPFAPKAFIIEAKQDGNARIYKLSGGYDNGLNAGDELTIFSRRLMQNPLTGKESIEEVELTKGKISTSLGSNYAWITVDNTIESSRIRLGDLARVRYSKGFLEKIGGLID